MKVLVVTPWYEPQRGGVATVATELSRALARQGHAVSVVLKKSGSRKKLDVVNHTGDGVRLCSMLLRGPVDRARPLRALLSFLWHAPATLGTLLRFVRQEQFDVVNLHYPTPSDIYWVLVRLLTGVPVCVTIHGSDLLEFEARPVLHRIVVRAVLRTADRIVHSTVAFRDLCLVSAYPGAEAKAAHVPLAMDLPEPADLRDSGPLPKPPASFILCVAHLIPKKGIDILLEAFAGLVHDHSEDLVIVGDGPSRAGFERLADQRGLHGRVVFTGAVSRAEVMGLMRSCAFFVLPSRFESFGLVNLEAHACGKAVVSTRVGGIPEVVEHGVSGLLVDPDDAEGLRQAMRTLLMDDRLRARLGEAGYEQSQRRGHTWAVYANRCCEVFALAREGTRRFRLGLAA